MRENVVTTTAINALSGLHLTTDMFFCATHFTWRALENFVDEMHLRQPNDSDYDAFADMVNDNYHDWTVRYPVSSANTGVMFNRTAIAAADLAGTYGHIKRGMQAMVDLVFAIHLRSKGYPDDGMYRRVIPPELVDMRLDRITTINVSTFLRILNIDPWRSWLQRLRAQKQRTVTQLANEYVSKQLEEEVRLLVGASKLKFAVIDAWKQKHDAETSRIARKSIIKSFKMFERLDATDLLRRFLASATGEAVEIEGHAYNYQIKMYANTLYTLTLDCNLKMTYMSTHVYNKQGERLCQVCHYFKETPILDSVLATVLTVRNPETELEFLNAACIVEAPRWFYDDPLLPILKNMSDPAAAPGMVENIFRFADTYNNEPLRDLLYARTLPMAYSAFLRIMRPGKRYLSIMRHCGDFEMWEIMIGTEDRSIDPFTIVQQAIHDGVY